jgi:predicted metal-dependent phosphoesterase TrpH
MIDLHIHTNASSDGQYSPQEIFRMAREKGLRAIAFADHNSIGNVEQGIQLAGEFGIEFIPCMELNTLYREMDLHLLAYFLDPADSLLREWLREVRRKKGQQAVKRMEKLNELGFFFTAEDLEKFSEEQIPTGRSFLQAILSREENRKDPRLRPYIDGNRSRSPYVNFYRDYLRGGKPGFVPMDDVSTVSAIRKVRELGAIPVLAHPSDTGEANLRDLVEHGLEGLEAYSPYHDPPEQEGFRTFAERYGLLVTAGSDFHGEKIKPDIELGQVSGHPPHILEKLKERRKERR